MKTNWMQRSLLAGALGIAGTIGLARSASAAGPVTGLGSVDDQGHLFSQAAVDRAQSAIEGYRLRTGHGIYIRTAPAIDATIEDDAKDEYARRDVHGIELYVVASEKQDTVLADPTLRIGDGTSTVRKAFEDHMQAGDADGALAAAVTSAGALLTQQAPVPVAEVGSGLPSWAWILVPLGLMTLVLGILVLQQRRAGTAPDIGDEPVPDEPADEFDPGWNGTLPPLDTASSGEGEERPAAPSGSTLRMPATLADDDERVPVAPRSEDATMPKTEFGRPSRNGSDDLPYARPSDGAVGI